MAISKDEEIVRRGLNSNPKIINPTDQLLNNLKEYSELPIAKNCTSIHQMTIENALYDAQTFLLYYFKLHKVPTETVKKLLGKQIHFGRYINPLKLPINLTNSDDIFSAAVEEVITKQDSFIIFRHINLSKQVTEQTSSSYIHEITHTQLDSLKGSFRDYYNFEVLSVFNELFHASILDKDEKILRLNDSRRIHEMFVTAVELRNHHNGTSPMDREELLDCCKYLISDLKAYKLFSLFYYANDSIRAEILDAIQVVFDGYLTVEELLLKFDVTYDSLEDSKNILKYYKR